MRVPSTTKLAAICGVFASQAIVYFSVGGGGGGVGGGGPKRLPVQLRCRKVMISILVLRAPNQGFVLCVQELTIENCQPNNFSKKATVWDWNAGPGARLGVIRIGCQNE